MEFTFLQNLAPELFTDLFTQDFYDKLFKIGVKHEKMLYDFCHKPEEDDQVGFKLGLS